MSISKNDTVIKELLVKVEEQKKSLGSRVKIALETNGIFRKDINYCFNLNTVQDVTVLANALGFLIAKGEAFKEACRRLGVQKDYKWDGYTVEEWEADFKARIGILEWNKKKALLEATKKKLNKLVSAEVKTEMDLEEIIKSLG